MSSSRRYALRDDQWGRIEHLLPGRSDTIGVTAWNNTHRRHSRWAATGVWERVFKALAEDSDNEYAMIDSSIVRAHQASAGARKKGALAKRSGAPREG